MIKNIDQLDWQPVTMPGAQLVKFRVLMGRNDQAPTFAIRQFEVEPHGHTPLHQHNYEHEVIVQNGEGVMKAGVDTHDIGPGQVILVPANQLHQFRNTGLQPLRFLCMVPVNFDCGGGQCKDTPGS
jgi:quercetin dioxygenase-like cupin family protein